MDDFEMALQDFSAKGGKVYSEEEFRRYLERRRMTAAEYLVEAAEQSAYLATWQPRPAPDPEKEPELYEQYLKFTMPFSTPEIVGEQLAKQEGGKD